MAQAHDLLLLHGAGLGAWIWTTTKARLTVSAQAVDLPGRPGGASPDSVSLQDCVDHVVAVLYAADSPPIIVAHSFSAQVALVAASQHPERVRALVLVAGMVPDSGRSFLSLLPFPARLLLGLVIRLSRRGVRLPRAAVVKEYCNDLDAATTAMVVDRLCPEVPRLYLDAVQWSRMPPHVPVIYVKLLDDASVPPVKQDDIIRRVRASRIETIPGGHLAMLSRPGEVAATLSRIASQLS